jgi:hypothetical protein
MDHAAAERRRGASPSPAPRLSRRDQSRQAIELTAVYGSFPSDPGRQLTLGGSAVHPLSRRRAASVTRQGCSTDP